MHIFLNSNSRTKLTAKYTFNFYTFPVLKKTRFYFSFITNYANYTVTNRVQIIKRIMSHPPPHPPLQIDIRYRQQYQG